MRLGDQIEGDLQDGRALLLGVAFDVLQREHPRVHREQRGQQRTWADSGASGSLSSSWTV